MTYALLSFADLYHRTHFSIFHETTELSVSFILVTQAGNDSQFPPKDLVDGNVGQDFFFTAYGIFLSSQDRCKTNFIFPYITKTDFSVRQCNWKGSGRSKVFAKLKCPQGKFCGIISVKYSGKCSSKTKLLRLFEETFYFVALQGAAQEWVALSAATSYCKIYLQQIYNFLRIRTLCQEVQRPYIRIFGASPLGYLSALRQHTNNASQFLSGRGFVSCVE